MKLKLGLASAGLAFLLWAYAYSAYLFLFWKPAAVGAGMAGAIVPLAALAFIVPAFLWLVGLILALLSLLVGRGVRSAALASIYALASFTHFTWPIMGLAAAGWSVADPASEALILLGLPAAIGLLFAAAAVRSIPS